MVGKYIKELLFGNECIILPDFGGFLTQYISADIHPITHKMQPPSRRVAFNAYLKNDDGILINAIIEKEGMLKEEAEKEISAFINEINNKLNSIGIFEIKDVGRFYYNKENQLEFEPDASINYHEDSFGLPELFFKPIDRNTISMNQIQRPVRPSHRMASENGTDSDKSVKKTSPVLIILPIILLLLGGATAFLYFNQDNKSLASINPFVMLASGEEKKPETKAVTPVADTAVVEEVPSEVEMANENEITSHTGRYFIVAGSFKHKENAEKLRSKFEAQNVSSTIIEPEANSNFYRVAVADFDNKEAALSKLKELKATYGKKIWVLSY
jgi:flagellar basal body-associated protein FliL